MRRQSCAQYALLAAAMISSLALAGCSRDSDHRRIPNILTVWTTEGEAERVEAQRTHGRHPGRHGSRRLLH